MVVVVVLALLGKKVLHTGKRASKCEHSHLWRGNSILAIDHKHRYRASNRLLGERMYSRTATSLVAEAHQETQKKPFFEGTYAIEGYKRERRQEKKKKVCREGNLFGWKKEKKEKEKECSDGRRQEKRKEQGGSNRAVDGQAGLRGRRVARRDFYECKSGKLMRTSDQWLG